MHVDHGCIRLSNPTTLYDIYRHGGVGARSAHPLRVLGERIQLAEAEAQPAADHRGHISSGAAVRVEATKLVHLYQSLLDMLSGYGKTEYNNNDNNDNSIDNNNNNNNEDNNDNNKKQNNNNTLDTKSEPARTSWQAPAHWGTPPPAVNTASRTGAEWGPMVIERY